MPRPPTRPSPPTLPPAGPAPRIWRGCLPPSRREPPTDPSSRRGPRTTRQIAPAGSGRVEDCRRPATGDPRTSGPTGCAAALGRLRELLHDARAEGRQVVRGATGRDVAV